MKGPTGAPLPHGRSSERRGKQEMTILSRERQRAVSRVFQLAPRSYEDLRMRAYGGRIF